MTTHVAAALQDAAWITTPALTPLAGRRPAYLFRRAFTLATPLEEAVLTITAHGVYEAFLNGTRIGDLELTPGVSSYQATLYVQQYDVSTLLRSGINELRVVVSDGWYRGRTGAHRVPDSFGDQIALIAALHLDTGSWSTVVATDTTWETGTGEVVAADLMDGQTTDLRLIGTTAWEPVVLSEDPLTRNRDRFAVSPSPAVRKIEQYPPVAITRLPGGRQIVDFGQILNGWVTLSRLGPEDTRIDLTHGEAVDTAGDLTLGHLDITVAPGLPTLPVGQKDTVISRGAAGDVFEPRHTSHGFRYVAIDGHPDTLTTADITAHQVRTDLTHTGTFVCSDDRANRLHDIATQSWRANTLDIPTDCPQRERWGYTGDFQIFARSAAYLDDITGFARKWLTSLADDQHADGKITNVAPNIGIEPEPVIPISFDGSAGWGDAATIIPWELYRAYGDASILRDFFPMMRAWVDYAAGVAATGRHATRTGEPAAHEQFLWDTGWHWGEWLEPDVPFTPNQDPAIVATAYLAHSARIVADTADLLAETTGHRQLADDVAAAWRTEFLRPDGTLTVPTQANYTRALAFDLIPADLVPVVADHLVRLVEENGNHLSTGFLSTGLLLPTLAANGYPDVAYNLLFQTDEPGWLVMLERGATTVWEAWNGIDRDGIPHESLNHYSKGAVITFLHENVAGIRPTTPGYRTVQIHPHIDARLHWAEGALHTVHGQISTRWETHHDHTVTVTVILPDGVTGEVIMPDGTRYNITAGQHRFTGTLPAPSSRQPYPDRRGETSELEDLTVEEEHLQWGRFHPDTTLFGEVLDDPDARAILDQIVPGLADNPMIEMARPAPVGIVLTMTAGTLDPDTLRQLRHALAAL